jgi:hypothetical protein
LRQAHAQHFLGKLLPLLALWKKNEQQEKKYIRKVFYPKSLTVCKMNYLTWPEPQGKFPQLFIQEPHKS